MSEDESPRSDPHASVPVALLPWQKKPRFSWTPTYETTFFQSLCQSVQLGLRENMSFKPEAWNRALVVLRELGAYPTKPHLINKTDNARKKFRLWRGLVENPQFTYDPATGLITGSEEAWQAHLEKEPLARAFRDRPFENAEYLEILFPDVVGSAGQPKRVTRPRRKGPDTLAGDDTPPPPGTGVMRLQNGPGGVRMNANASATGVNPATPVPVPSNNNVNNSRNNNNNNTPGGGRNAQAVGVLNGPNVQIRPAPTNGGASAGGPGSASITSIPPPPPPTMRQLGGGNAAAAANRAGAALTPPDEANAVGQKRFAPGPDGTSTSATTTSTGTTAKRRRTESSIHHNAATGGGSSSSNAGGGAGRHRSEASGTGGFPSSSGISAAAGGGGQVVSGVAAGGAGNDPFATGVRSVGGAGGSSFGSAITTASATSANATNSSAAAAAAAAAASRVDGIAGLLSDVLTKYATATTAASTTRWPEQALETFFYEFADEDMDLQLRIAEKILTDTSKAVMFCKMPAVLRKHWVKRLREASSRLGN
ncbi:hypothetical protein SPI_01674 [Niveomyces insectorum RCEF 264]|uniref:Myb/SANT-like domain-containing protein n=1 Tax=Niveomyces insectorum RCEF 264 TaxID=1081102 RepID=A0A167Z508_9HYPO|nr:hypothetical protein SPI_01674 [Niveomyces insectorum RCEF 264]